MFWVAILCLRWAGLVKNSVLRKERLPRVYPFEVKVEGGEAGVAQPSKILLDQIRTVDKARLGNRIGQLPSRRIEELNRAIRLSLAV